MVVAALIVGASVLQPEPEARPLQTPSEPKPQYADNPRDLADILEPILKKHKIPAMAAAAVYDRYVVSIGVAGVRAAGHDEKVTLEDKWHLGSCTKAMTATLAGTMVGENGLGLTWETTLGEVFTDIAMKDAWKPVTLGQLVMNRGGVPTSLDADGLWAKLWNVKGTPTEARLELLKGVTAWEPAAAPGSKFIYSNGGFAMAGAMLERKSGKAWETLMQERVFAPLKITTGGFGPPGKGGKAAVIDQPRGHRGGKAIDPDANGADNPVAIGPAGTVHMSIGDWAKFIAWHANEERGKKGDAPASLMPAETAKFLHTPYPAAGKDDKDQYAGGWVVTTRPWAKGKAESDTGRVLNHNGSNTMWYCVTWVAPERRFAVVIACNQGDGPVAQATDEVAGKLIELHLKNAKP